MDINTLNEKLKTHATEKGKVTSPYSDEQRDLIHQVAEQRESVFTMTMAIAPTAAIAALIEFGMLIERAFRAEQDQLAEIDHLDWED